jgi:hypothetical protein
VAAAREVGLQYYYRHCVHQPIENARKYTDFEIEGNSLEILFPPTTHVAAINVLSKSPSAAGVEETAHIILYLGSEKRRAGFVRRAKITKIVQLKYEVTAMVVVCAQGGGGGYSSEVKDCTGHGLMQGRAYSSAVGATNGSGHAYSTTSTSAFGTKQAMTCFTPSWSVQIEDSSGYNESVDMFTGKNAETCLPAGV